MLRTIFSFRTTSSPVHTAPAAMRRSPAPPHASTPSRVGPVNLRPRPSAIVRVFGTDRVCAVGFHDTAFVISLPADPSDPLLHDRVNTLHQRVGGSGTNITDAIRKSVKLLDRVPRGYLKRIKLICDGRDNRQREELSQAVAEAYRAHVNCDVIPIGGDGCSFDLDRLRAIASGTHNGKVIGVSHLRDFADALKYTAGNAHPGQHRAEVTCLAIDLSPSMNEMWDKQRKIDAVAYAIRRLLTIKQKLA